MERVIIAFSRLKTDELVEISRQCMDMGVQVDIVPRMYEVIGSRNVVHYLDGMPLLGLRTPRLSRSSRLIKRSFDLAVAVPILLALSPLFLFVAWRIRATSPGPVFFRQERMGAGGKRFRIWKFRTMYIDADARKAEVGAHERPHRVRPEDVQDPRRPAHHADRREPAQVVDRRDAAAHQRRCAAR